MATGYTYPVADGKITKFSDFALSCARAFGALITMRDDPMDAPVPNEIKPSTYHADKLPLLRAQIVSLQGMSSEDAQAGADRDYAAKLEDRAKSDRECAERNGRITAMLAAVEDWTPPSDDHAEMKRFMRDQLSMSIDKPYARDPAAQMSGTDWLAAQIASAKHDLEYHEAENAKEIERARTRTEWIQQLRASLEPQSKAA